MKNRSFTPPFSKNDVIKILRFFLKKKNAGFTLIEVLVGIFLFSIVFLGIFGAYELGLRVVGLSRNKIIATAIANQQIEMIRNLPYQSVGTKGGFPNGVLEVATTTIFNNIEYRIEIRVDYVVDPADGIAFPDDECPNDYKRVEIKVSWTGQFLGQVELSTDIAPKNLTQECATGGGVLSVSVFDAQGVMIPSPLIEIRDPETDQVLKSATPIQGQHYFSLATSTYKVIISKSGYSAARTYGTQEITTPENPHPSVLEDRLIEVSFSIDKISTFSVNTLSPRGSDNFSDSFSDESKISEKSNLVVSEGEANLATTTEGYLSSGYLISTDISPTDLAGWDELNFTDSEPLDTDLKYQIFYASGTDWFLIPNTDLPGNSIGFDVSLVDLSVLSTSTYSQLKIRGNFSANTTSTTPTLYSWQISWNTMTSFPIPNADFSLRGDKIIGTDANEEPVYKYSIATTSDFSGHKDIPNLEWDFYTFSIDPSTGLDLVDISPSPQPVNLSPDTTLPVNLYLDAENSLLLTVEDSETLKPIFAADVRLYNLGLGYDIIRSTNEKGQTIFIPLQSATYNLEVQGPGYLSTSTAVSITNDVIKIIKLERIE